jgi:hypothetical protein
MRGEQTSQGQTVEEHDVNERITTLREQSNSEAKHSAILAGIAVTAFALLVISAPQSMKDTQQYIDRGDVVYINTPFFSETFPAAPLYAAAHDGFQLLKLAGIGLSTTIGVKKFGDSLRHANEANLLDQQTSQVKSNNAEYPIH